MISDLRYVLRSLVRNRAFTAVTVLTLAFGIGAGGSIFSLVDWVLFRGSSFPKDIYLVGGQNEMQPFMPVRFEFMTRAYETEKRAVQDFAKVAYRQGNIVVRDQPVDTQWLGVSPALFPMFGITPRVGRGFLPEEAVEGADQVVVISDRFWKTHLGGRDDALGQKIIVGDASCTVVGILREGQQFPPFLHPGVFRPLVYRVNPDQPWSNQFFYFIRLAAGVSREQAEAALRVTTSKIDLPAQYWDFYKKDRVSLSSIGELNRFSRPEVFWVMLGAVGFLYAIACLNASNLMLVRMLGLRRELSIRLALGGGRWRIIRLLTLESVVLALLSGLAGLLVANWLFPLLLSATGGAAAFGQRDWTSWTLGWRIVGVMSLLTVITSLIIALIPAVRVLRTEINSGLKDGGAALGEGRALARIRGLLVVLQAAFAVVLLVGAGLMIRTFANFQKVDLGFEPAGLVKVFLGLPPNFPQDPKAWEAQLTRLREIQSELQRLPGVRAVGFGQDVLLPGWYNAFFAVLAHDDQPVKTALTGFNLGFQEAAGIKLKRGRWHNKSQGNEILINESLAKALWPAGTDPVGQFLRTQDKNPYAPADWKGWEVVGVVADLRGTMRDAPGRYIYGPEAWSAGSFGCFVLRVDREFDIAFATDLRRKLYAFDPHIVVHDVQPASRAREQQLWAEQMANAMLKVLAGIALLLTIVGIFSVLAYTVDRRMGEFGVRLALGATPRELVRLVMRRGVMLTLMGISVGVGGALALNRYLQSMLFEVTGTDPMVLAAVAGLLLVIAVLACIVPAQRAAKADVAKLLRSE